MKNVTVTMIVFFLIFTGCSTKENDPKNQLKKEEVKKVIVTKKENSGNKDRPILIGPPGTRFWTTLKTAQSIIGNKVKEIVKLEKLTGRLLTSADSSGNRYCGVRQGEKTTPIVCVAQVEMKYESVPGDMVRFYQTENGPLFGFGQGLTGYYHKKKDGHIVKIGIRENKYRKVDGQMVMMSKSLNENDKLTCGINGKILHRTN